MLNKIINNHTMLNIENMKINLEAMVLHAKKFAIKTVYNYNVK